MKTKLYVLLAGVLFLMSCSEEFALEDNSLNESVFDSSVKYTEGVVYPLTDKPLTRSVTIDSNWEQIEKVTLPSGISVNTPWANYASGDIPVDVMRDIKLEDGWELIAHTMTPSNESGQNYLVFHNYTTGILKVFYYLENYQTNNMGIWHLQFDGGTQKYFNFADQVADPICHDGVRTSIDITNLTEKSSKGFSAGWNCFQVELAYDPLPLCSSLRISAINYNVQNMDLGGEYNSATNGLLISKSTSNPFSSMVNGVANLTGNSAEKWYNNKFGKNLTESNSRGIIAGVVAAGAKLLLNSLVSRFKKETTTTQEIQLKTHGTINLSGTINMENPSPVKSITLNTSLLGKLGAWNLETWPSALIYPHGYLNHISGEDYYYRTSWSTNKCSIVMNPKLQAKLVNNSVQCDLINYTNGAPECIYNNETFNRGEIGGKEGSQILYSDNESYELLFSDEQIVMGHYKLLKLLIPIKMDKYIPSLGGVPKECDLLRYDVKVGLYASTRGCFMRVAPSFSISINNKQYNVDNVKTFLPTFGWLR